MAKSAGPLQRAPEAEVSHVAMFSLQIQVQATQTDQTSGQPEPSDAHTAPALLTAVKIEPRDAAFRPRVKRLGEIVPSRLGTRYISKNQKLAEEDKSQRKYPCHICGNKFKEVMYMTYCSVFIK